MSYYPPLEEVVYKLHQGHQKKCSRKNCTKNNPQPIRQFPQDIFQPETGRLFKWCISCLELEGFRWHRSPKFTLPNELAKAQRQLKAKNNLTGLPTKAAQAKIDAYKKNVINLGVDSIGPD